MTSETLRKVLAMGAVAALVSIAACKKNDDAAATAANDAAASASQSAADANAAAADAGAAAADASATANSAK